MIEIEIGNLLTRKYPGVEINVADKQICKIAVIVCYVVLFDCFYNLFVLVFCLIRWHVSAAIAYHWVSTLKTIVSLAVRRMCHIFLCYPVQFFLKFIFKLE